MLSHSDKHKIVVIAAISWIILSMIILCPMLLFAQDTLRVSHTTTIINLLNGQRQAVISNGYINYRDSIGVWRKTDTSVRTDLVPKRFDGYDTGVIHAEVMTFFPGTLAEPILYIHQKGTKVSYRFKGLAYLNTTTGDYKMFEHLNLASVRSIGLRDSRRSSNPESYNNAVVYKEVYSGIDVVYLQTLQGPKQEVVLSEEVRENLSPPLGYTAIAVVEELETNFSVRVGRTILQGTFADGMRAVDGEDIVVGENLFLTKGKAYSLGGSEDIKMKRYTDLVGGKNIVLTYIPVEILKDTETYPGRFVLDSSFNVGETSYGQVETWVSSTWLAARSATTGGYRTDWFEAIVRKASSSEWGVWRGFAKYDLSGWGGGAVSEAYLQVSVTQYKGASDTYICEGFDYGTLDGGDFDGFPGWQSGSTPYTTTKWSGAFDPGGTGTKNISFNATGRAAIEAAAGGDFFIVGLNKYDYDYITPTGFHGWNTDAATTLYITYTPPPDPPTNVAATDGTYYDKVVVTWTKASGATGYEIHWSSSSTSGYSLLTSVGDVATYNSTTAPAPTPVAPTVVATDGTWKDYVLVSWSGASITQGATKYYKLKSKKNGSTSGFSNYDGGYRDDTVDPNGYKIQRSAGDSDADYSDLASDQSTPYQDTAAPAGTAIGPSTVAADGKSFVDSITVQFNAGTTADGAGRYYRVRTKSTGGLTGSYSTANRGYRGKYGVVPTGYRIDTCHTSGGTFVKWDSAKSASTDYRIALARPADSLYVKVATVDSGGAIGWSSADMGVTLPEAPDGLSSYVINEDSSWTIIKIDEADNVSAAYYIFAESLFVWFDTTGFTRKDSVFYSAADWDSVKLRGVRKHALNYFRVRPISNWDSLGAYVSDSLHVGLPDTTGAGGAGAECEGDTISILHRAADNRLHRMEVVVIDTLDN